MDNRAAVLIKPLQIRVEERAAPSPSPEEVLLRIRSSAICGTDLKIFRGDIAVNYPRIMGHEMAGEIIALGENVEGLSVGDRVLVNPVVSCGECYWCRIGRDNVCPRGALYGRDVDGGFATLLAMPASSLFPLPDSVGWSEAPVIQVLTTVVRSHALIDIFPGDVVAVIGLGVSGQLHVQVAKSRGATVIGTTRSPWKRALAEELGCDATCPPDQIDQTVKDMTARDGAAFVIDAAGSPSTLRQALRLVRLAGTILEFGLLTGKRLEMPLYDLYYKELSVIHPRASRAIDFPTSIELVASEKVRIRELITEKLPLEEIESGVKRTTDGTSMKVVLEHR
jgi:L-iditol 2-dehydrogenase